MVCGGFKNTQQRDTRYCCFSMETKAKSNTWHRSHHSPSFGLCLDVGDDNDANANANAAAAGVTVVIVTAIAGVAAIGTVASVAIAVAVPAVVVVARGAGGGPLRRDWAARFGRENPNPRRARRGVRSNRF
jgi:hypothetical protein